MHLRWSRRLFLVLISSICPPAVSLTLFCTDTYITYTLGTFPSGLPDPQKAYLQAAQKSGVTVDGLTLMTMDMGNDGKDNVGDAMTAISGGAAQLAEVYSLNLDDATKKMGMLPAIGVDDFGGVVNLGGATKRECVLYISTNPCTNV
jgi:hypothetical protein